MAGIKKKVGFVLCPVCGKVECAVKCDNGDTSKTLGYPCSQGCDNPGWAPAGSEAHEIILKRMKPLAGAVAVKPAAPAPAPSPAHAPSATEKKTAGFFS